MFYICFGLLWSLISIPSLILSITGQNEMMATIFLLIFSAIGIVMIALGIKEVLRNRATEKNGEYCFGKVLGVKETGERVNGNSLYKAKVIVYIPSESKSEIVEEKIGFDCFKYPVGSYVSVKYYCGDINFEYSAYEKNIPEYIKQKLDEKYEVNPIENGFEEFQEMEPEINTTVQESTIQINKETLQNAKRLINKIIGTVLLVFGSFWTFIVAIITIVFYGTPGDVSVNGVMVSHEEYVSMLEPKIFMGIFWIIGICMLGAGAYNLIKGFWKSQDDSNNEFIGSEYDKFEYYEKTDDDDPIRKF